jgi:hypothetical protein
VDKSTVRPSLREVKPGLCPDCFKDHATESPLAADGHCIICGYSKTPAVAP